MGENNMICGNELAIYGVEDFIAFTHVRHLEYLPGAHQLRHHYIIQKIEGWVDNDWVICPDFVVHRRSTVQSIGGTINVT